MKKTEPLTEPSTATAPSGPQFAMVGRHTDDITVRISYRIIQLFSEGLYKSPTKAIEELVANSFDAGVGIPMMSISHSDLMPIRSERSDAGLSQCETVIGIRQEVCLLSWS